MRTEYEVPALPAWLFVCRLDCVLGSEGEVGQGGVEGLAEEARGVVRELALLECEIGGAGGERDEERDEGGSSAGPGGAYLVALARLLLGACCEAYVVKKCSRSCRAGHRPTNEAGNRKLARLYKDSCHAAVWTSAHALYVHDLVNYGLNAARPSLHSVRSEFSEPDLSRLYAHRVSSKPALDYDAAGMLSLLTRCTNPGARGWDSTLQAILTESAPVRRVLADALLVSLTGMHSAAHPAFRLRWRDRLALEMHLSTQSLTNAVAEMHATPAALKELVRRLLSNCVSSDLATTHAVENLEHPVAYLAGNQMRLRPEGLEFSSVAFLEAGKRVLHGRGELGVERAVKEATAFEALPPPAPDRTALRWNASYLGKGSAAIHTKVPATAVAANLWATAFRCNFTPFWVHSNAHDVRVARLNQSQYAALHEMNAATRLTALLSPEQQLAAQRLALATPESGLMTLEEVGSLLGLPNVRGTSCNGGSKNIADTLSAISADGFEGAARLLHFCRAASVSENVVIYDLGERTRRMQAAALVKRSLADEFPDAAGARAEDLVARIPEHTRHLCACVECKRVSNAVACDGVSSKPTSSFNEIGTSGTMASASLHTDSCHLRCAKRSSTSLKSAVAFEEEMCNIMPEAMEVKEDAFAAAMVVGPAGAGNGVCARVRRDAKSAFEQREYSVACGAEPMLSVPLLGKAVRLWDSWYALCSFCGCFARVSPKNRFEAEICCLRCDYDMLNRNNVAEKAAVVKGTGAPSCRFCGKVRYSPCPPSHTHHPPFLASLSNSTRHVCSQVDPQRSGARWKLVKSPMDTSGRNATLPPPLRYVHFCPAHFRSWIPVCAKTMQTRVILSHIVYGAKPTYDVKTDPHPEDDDFKRPSKSSGKKRKRSVVKRK